MLGKHWASTIAGFGVLAIGACSSLPTATDGSTVLAPEVAPRAGTIHVHSGRASLVYTLLSFDKECHPVQPRLSVEQQPTKGDVTFKPETTGTVLSSPSGQCVGTRMPGTAILYTPRDKQSGTDTFSIMAVTNSGGVGTRSFTVEIVD